MRTIVFFSLCCILGSLLFLASCKEDCPEFPEHIIDYFPYQTGDTLSFVNQFNDTISFWVSRAETTRPTQQSVSRCSKCECDLPQIWVYGSGHHQSYIGMEITVGKNPYLHFSLSDKYWDGVAKTASSLWKWKYDESGKNLVDTKNSTLFGETVNVDDPEFANQQISKVIIVKGKGITEFFDQKFNFQWNSINSKK